MNTQINPLTSTRGFAAILVVIYHYGYTIFPFNHIYKFIVTGNVAVSYFFVLSGFVMYYAYAAKNANYAGFIKKRVARIFPLYFIALILSITPGVLKMEHYFIKTILSALFLQAFIPNAIIFNVPGWSLSVEMFFYCLFPLLLLFQRNYFRYFLLATVIIWAASQVIHMYMISNQVASYEITHYFPFFHINEFMIGMVGGYAWTKLKDKKIILGPLPVFIAIVLMLTYLHDFVSFHNGLLAPVFILFILLVALKPPAFLNNSKLIYFGEISYAIYILQNPIHSFVDKLFNPKFFHLSPAGMFYVYVLILVLVSALLHKIVEIPMQNYINSLSIRRSLLSFKLVYEKDSANKAVNSAGSQTKK